MRKAWPFLLFLLPLGAKIAFAGPLGNLLELIKLDREVVEQKKELLFSNLGAPLSPESEYLVDPDWLKSVYLHTPVALTLFLGKDLCQFGNFLQAFSPPLNSDKEQLIFLIDKNKKKSSSTSLEEARRFFRTKCPQIKETAFYFQNGRKKSYFDLPFFGPSISPSECSQHYTAFIEHPASIHFCSLALTPMRTGNASLANQLSIIEKKILLRSCTSATMPSLFCAARSSISYWDKVLAELRDKRPLKFLCTDLEEKLKLNFSDLKACVDFMRAHPDACSTLSSSLAAGPACSSIEIGLDQEQNAFDKDCGDDLENKAPVTISRLLSWLRPEGSKTKAKKSGSDCVAKSYRPFLDFIEDTPLDSSWETKLCYKLGGESKNRCLNFIFSNDRSYGLASRIEVYLRQKFPQDLIKNRKLNCAVVSPKQYFPQLLKFQTGCFLVTNFNQCKNKNCKMKIVLNGKEKKAPQFEFTSSYELFPTSSQKTNESIFFWLKKRLKFSTKKVNSLGDYQVLAENSKGPVAAVGIGCAEALVSGGIIGTGPLSCTPSSFLITALGPASPVGPVRSVIVRTDFDSSTTPRVLLWTQVVQSVFLYQQTLSYSFWPLHAVY